MMQKMKRDNEKQVRLLTTIVASLLITSLFTLVPTFSIQPPLDSTTYYIGTLGQPSRLDPMRAYDTASGEIIQNVYQPLIWFADKHPITFTSGVGYNLTVADYANLTRLRPMIATEVPTSANGRILQDTTGQYWRFTLNTSATFQPWIAANGSLMPSRAVTVDDVVYSFRRQMVYDSPYAPTKDWFKPALGIVSWDDLFPSYANGTFRYPENESEAGSLIAGWCYPGDGNDVIFHFNCNWNLNLLYQIFAQTWGSIVNKDWVMEHGGWDGLFTTGVSASDMSAGWTNNYRWKPTRTRSELDAYKDPDVYGVAHGSKYTTGDNDVPTMLGTGPYNFTSWDQTSGVWRIDRWANYWMGWQQAGNMADNYISTVISKKVDSRPIRKMLFLAGELDELDVQSDEMEGFLQLGSHYDPIVGINLVNFIPRLANRAFLFTMNISETSPLQCYVGYPVHLTPSLPYFFNNTHLRTAFAWAFDYATYIQQAYLGEAIVQPSWWVDGLWPPDYKNTNSSMPPRTLNSTEIQNELDQTITEGYNVSEVGFEMTLTYDVGNYPRMSVCLQIAQVFAFLGYQYRINVVGLDWPAYLDLRDSRGLAMYDVDCTSDIADPENFARAYVHSSGAFPISQGPPYPEDQAVIDAEVDAALVEQNSTARKMLYQDLQYRYWLDVISFPMGQPVGRRWTRDWVYGWYFNALFPGIYAYDLWKSVAGVVQPVDIDVVNTLTPIATWQRVYWYKNGTAIVGYTEGVGPANGSRAVYNYSLSIRRLDNNIAVPILVTVVSLKRVDLNNSNSATNTFYTSTQLIFLAIGDTKIISLIMEEDGTYVMFFPANHTYSISAVASIYSPANAYDTNASNNEVLWGNMKTQGPLRSDLKIDGIVNVLDSIVLGLHFGQSQGDPKWDPNCDLKTDGKINILDSIILGNDWGKTAPGPQYP